MNLTCSFGYIHVTNEGERTLPGPRGPVKYGTCPAASTEGRSALQEGVHFIKSSCHEEFILCRVHSTKSSFHGRVHSMKSSFHAELIPFITNSCTKTVFREDLSTYSVKS